MKNCDWFYKNTNELQQSQVPHSCVPMPYPMVDQQVMWLKRWQRVLLLESWIVFQVENECLPQAPDLGLLPALQVPTQAKSLMFKNRRKIRSIYKLISMRSTRQDMYWRERTPHYVFWFTCWSGRWMMGWNFLLKGFLSVKEEAVFLFSLERTMEANWSSLCKSASKDTS